MKREKGNARLYERQMGTGHDAGTTRTPGHAKFESEPQQSAECERPVTPDTRVKTGIHNAHVPWAPYKVLSWKEVGRCVPGRDTAEWMAGV